MNSDAFNDIEDIENLESDLWEAASNLRANSKLTSSDYFMPVLGIIFFRHAANRFAAAHRQIEADQTGGTMPKRKACPADYIARRSEQPAIESRKVVASEIAIRQTCRNSRG